MASTVAWLVVLVGVLGLSGAARAQDRLFVSGGVPTLPYTEEIVSGTPFGVSLGPRSPLVHQPLIAGGRYVAAATNYCELLPCVVVDWQGVAHPLPYAFVSIVATDPVRPRVFVQTASGTVDAVDVETGAVTSMFATSTAVSGQCRYAFSVARLFAGETGAASETLVLTYVATGARVPVALPAVWELAWDDFNERLLVMPAPSLGHAFTEDLAYLGSASFPFTAAAIAVSASSGRLYARGLVAQSAGYGDAYTTAFDSRTYTQITPTVHTQGFGGPPRITVLSPPGVPRDAAAVVNGRDVAVSWTNVGFASAFLLDVGVAPGQTALTVALPWQSQAAFAGVPAGTYYVRLRGANAFGVGRPSTELRVVVP